VTHRYFPGLFNKHVADEAPALPPGGQHDEPDLVLNEHVTEDEVCVVLKALRSACTQRDLWCSGGMLQVCCQAGQSEWSGRVERLKRDTSLRRTWPNCWICVSSTELLQMTARAWHC
jgi:hypothetical protein